jgi:hypothetical protein
LEGLQKDEKQKKVQRLLRPLGARASLPGTRFFFLFLSKKEGTASVYAVMNALLEEWIDTRKMVASCPSERLCLCKLYAL